MQLLFPVSDFYVSNRLHSLCRRICDGHLNLNLHPQFDEKNLEVRFFGAFSFGKDFTY